MKKRVILIGGGVIMRHYADGLHSSPTIEAVALCDLNADCLARQHFSDLPFFKDYRMAIERLCPDGAIVATPVSSHADIAKDCLCRGLDVYVEKPLCDNAETLREMYAVAKERGRTLTALFHWQHADEVSFLKRYLMGRKTEKIKVKIGDDYACDPVGTIRKDRIGLLGAWLDSGINALSYVQEILPLQNAKFVGKEEKTDPTSGLPYYVRRTFDVGGAEVEIEVDWTDLSRDKVSVIESEGERIFVNHTAQRVECGGRVIYESVVADRLASHYQNMFLEPFQKPSEDAERESKLLHEILLQR